MSKFNPVNGDNGGPPGTAKNFLSTLDRKELEESRKPSPSPSLPPTTEDFAITSLGRPTIETPLDFVHVVTDDDMIYLDVGTMACG
jgi:hypothetical protein